MKPQPRRNDKPTPTDPHLAELLDFRPDKGIIQLHEQRVVILSAAAMGLLRKELIDTLGLETARRVALRFGYADGYHDAVNLRERSNWSDPVEGVRAGAVLHRLEGIVRTEVSRIDHDASTVVYLAAVSGLLVVLLGIWCLEEWRLSSPRTRGATVSA